MTICIAAIANENGKEQIVFATDHMITTFMGQFEHSIVKYNKLNKNTVAMLAGQALLFDDLVKLDDNHKEYNQIKQHIFENFKAKRNEIIQHEIFNLYGIDQQFFIEILKREIANPFIHSILENVSEYSLETQILLIGFDNSLAQITNIEESGILDLRAMNFHAIGSGSIQAVNTLLFQKHSKNDSLMTSIYNVYKAKKNAEVSEGVGRETEILILSDNGVQQLSNENLDILNGIYYKELEYGKNNEELRHIIIEEAG